MTSSVTWIIGQTATAQGHENLMTTVDILVIVLLLVLLFEQELMRAAGGRRPSAATRILTGAIAPLLLAFVVFIVMRLLHFLQLV